MNYTLVDELKIDGLIKAKITELHHEINQSILSDRQKENLKHELKELRALQIKNRIRRSL